MKKLVDIEFIKNKIKSAIEIDKETDCWNFKNSVNSKGYAAVNWRTVKKFLGMQENAKLLLHRLSYETFKEKIPDGLVIDHLCRNPRCCNPDHLEPVTSYENTKRGIAWAPKFICKRGHEISGDNIKLKVGGGKQCLRCYKEAQAAWSKKNRTGPDCEYNKKRRKE